MSNEDRITVWGARSELLDSQYGRVTFFQWCLNEIDRVARMGRALRMLTRDDGAVALGKAGR